MLHKLHFSSLYPHVEQLIRAVVVGGDYPATWQVDPEAASAAAATAVFAVDAVQAAAECADDRCEWQRGPTAQASAFYYASARDGVSYQRGQPTEHTNDQGGEEGRRGQGARPPPPGHARQLVHRVEPVCRSQHSQHPCAGARGRLVDCGQSRVVL